MSVPDLFPKLRVLLAEQMARMEDFIRPNTELVEDLGMDDLDCAEFAITLEDMYPGIHFLDDSEEILGLETVQDLIEWINARTNGATPAPVLLIRADGSQRQLI